MNINLSNLTPAVEDMSEFETTVLVVGEYILADFEADMVRRRIVNFGPDVILHYSHYNEKDYYKKHLPSTKLLPIVTKKIDTSKSIKDVTKVTETNMVDNIKKQMADKKVKLLAIVVDDVHLRTLSISRYGEPVLTNYLNSIENITIVRSGHKEIE